MSLRDNADRSRSNDARRKSETANNNGCYTISSLDDGIQDSTANGTSNYVNITDKELPWIKEMLEETVKTSSVSTVEESMRRQLREWVKKEDYFDQYFRKIVRKKSDKATYGPQLLTWDILSELFQIVKDYRV